jgi:unsaturated chondroitin disaccharide hydrolase
MRENIVAFLVLTIAISCSPNENRVSESNPLPCPSEIPVDSLLHFAVNKYRTLIGNVSDSSLFPLSVKTDGDILLVNADNWTSGFFPGTLWMIYDFCNEDFFKQAAEKWTISLTSQKDNNKTHDIGFMIFTSFGNAYKITGKQEYLQIITEASKTLTTRFNPEVGCIRSWDWGKWKFPVIIDNLMNLEMLFFASQKTGDTIYSFIAETHAGTTLRDHFRDDYSSYHVIDYDPSNGKVIAKNTHQGYSDESAWSRGVAWSVYGYMLCYRETGKEKYLIQADNILSFILLHKSLSEDKVPFWDMDCPEIPDTYRDVSSAAILSSALVQLFELTGKNEYLVTCEKLVKSLACGKYTIPQGSKYGFLLDHSVGNINMNKEVDAPLIYADYYFVETLLKLKKIYESQKSNEAVD